MGGGGGWCADEVLLRHALVVLSVHVHVLLNEKETNNNCSLF